MQRFSIKIPIWIDLDDQANQNQYPGPHDQISLTPFESIGNARVVQLFNTFCNINFLGRPSVMCTFANAIQQLTDTTAVSQTEFLATVR